MRPLCINIGADRGDTGMIVFLTSSSEFAVESYHIEAFHIVRDDPAVALCISDVPDGEHTDRIRRFDGDDFPHGLAEIGNRFVQDGEKLFVYNRL